MKCYLWVLQVILRQVKLVVLGKVGLRGAKRRRGGYLQLPNDSIHQFFYSSNYRNSLQDILFY